MIYTIIFEGGAMATLDHVKHIYVTSGANKFDILPTWSLFELTIVDDLLGVQGQFIKFLKENDYGFLSEEREVETDFNIITKSRAERHFLINYLEKEVNDSLILNYKEVKLNE